jgi:protein tyrosine phosphatase
MEEKCNFLSINNRKIVAIKTKQDERKWRAAQAPEKKEFAEFYNVIEHNNPDQTTVSYKLVL